MQSGSATHNVHEKVSGAVVGAVNWGLPETCTGLNIPQVIRDRFPTLKLFGKCDGVGKRYDPNPEMVQLEGGQKAVRKGEGSSKCQLGRFEI